MESNQLVQIIKIDVNYNAIFDWIEHKKLNNNNHSS